MEVSVHVVQIVCVSVLCAAALLLLRQHDAQQRLSTFRAIAAEARQPPEYSYRGLRDALLDQ